MGLAKWALWIGALFSMTGEVLAEDVQHRRVNEIPRVIGTVAIDGDTSDALWSQATRMSLDFETRPGENTAAPVETHVLLMENGNSLLVAFEASDPEPEKIRAYLRDRDSAYSDDFVGVVLDTFNDQRRAFEFFVNPLGVQMDLTNDDINQEEDDSWDAIWDSAGQITDSGFVVEMKIPLSQLRFPKTDGIQTWGIDIIRNYPRDHRRRLAASPLDRDLNCYLCQLGKFSGLEGATPGKDLEITPTVTASRSALRADPYQDPLASGGTNSDLGVSVRWGVTPELTANLAINPDFSQVEADVAQLDVNNQFALFFPETRPFFLEGADYFRSPLNAVFTRTVADPAIGAKLTGKHGKDTFGFFVAEDRVTNLIFPGPFGSDSESLAIDNESVVARYSRGFGEASTVGALVTTRRADNYKNTVAGLDGRWKINDQHSIEAQFLRSSTEYPSEIISEFEQPNAEFDGDALRFNYDYSSRNWFAYARHADFDPNFRADSGFITRVDYEQQVLGLGRIWHGEETDWWTRIRVSGDWDITHDSEGRLIEKEMEAYAAINGPWQSYAEFGGLTRKVLFNNVLFQEDKLSLYVESSPRSGLFVGLWTRVGDQVDFANTRLGDEVRIQPQVNWNINRNLMLRLRGTFVQLDSKEGPNVFDARVVDTRLTWQFNVRSFIRMTLQQQDIRRNADEHIEPVIAHRQRLGRQLLYSYKLNPQTVFFLGYSDNMLEDDDLAQMTTTDRTVFMKIGYAWIP
ncbi:MAG: carbohydrate binding family 9 domain-containing protein [Woeseia sp.]|nr:carbohydrate binding family 9 domain-containing protein [Woeseia sp.]